ncbi:MAG: L-threonylcarbamoyladenylate synthase [Pirellulaceae bacterium]
MAPIVVDLKKIPDKRDAVHRAIEALAAGRIVAMPTETVYGVAACALHEDAVRRLFEIKNRPQTLPLIFLVKSADDALDFVPDMEPLARRMARKCWPGPLVLLLRGPHPDSVISRLPETVQEICSRQGWIGLRVPADAFSMDVLRLNAGPVLMCNSGTNELEPAATGQELIDSHSNSIDLIIDGGQCRFARPSTVVKIEGDNIEIVRRGVIDEQALKRMSEVNILIVCTGNTCRSPMAEGLLKRRLADRLKCDPASLGDCGYNVESAGIAAMPGGAVSGEAVEAASGVRDGYFRAHQPARNRTSGSASGPDSDHDRHS